MSTIKAFLYDTDILIDELARNARRATLDIEKALQPAASKVEDNRRLIERIFEYRCYKEAKLCNQGWIPVA